MAYFVVLLLLTAAHDTYGTTRSVESKGRESRDGNSGPGSWIEQWINEAMRSAMDTLSPLAEETVRALLSTIYEMTISSIIPYILSAILFVLVLLTNYLLWHYLRVSLKNILKIDSLLYIAYAWCGPELVLRYFQKSLYWASLALYTLIVSEHRSSWAILFFVLVWHRELMYVLVNLFKAMSAVNREVRRHWWT